MKNHPAFWRILGSVAVGLFLFIIALAFMGFFPSKALQETAARTEHILANVTKAEPSGYGFAIEYNFDYRGEQWSKGTTARQPLTYEKASKTKQVDIWFDPRNPNNSSVEEPSQLFCWVLISLPYLLDLFILFIYLLCLNGIWGWSWFKNF